MKRTIGMKAKINRSRTSREPVLLYCCQIASASAAGILTVRCAVGCIDSPGVEIAAAAIRLPWRPARGPRGSAPGLFFETAPPSPAWRALRYRAARSMTRARVLSPLCATSVPSRANLQVSVGDVDHMNEHIVREAAQGPDRATRFQGENA